MGIMSDHVPLYLCPASRTRGRDQGIKGRPGVMVLPSSLRARLFVAESFAPAVVGLLPARLLLRTLGFQTQPRLHAKMRRQSEFCRVGPASLPFRRALGSIVFVLDRSASALFRG